MAVAFAAGEVATIQYRLRHYDGHWEWAETTARSVGVEIQCSTRKITELHHRLAQQSAVARLGNMVMRGPDLDEVFDEATRAVADTLGADLVSVTEDLGGGRMKMRAGVGWPDGYVGFEFEMAALRVDGRSVYADGPFVVEDLPNDPAWRTSPLGTHGVVTSVNVLIGSPDAPMGVLGAHTRAKRTFSATDIDFMQSVAHMLAAAIGRLRVEDQMRHAALHDALTGLPNRTLLLDRLRHALDRTVRDGRRVALFFIDLDNLKVVNDSLGHHAGDELLCAMGPRLQRRAARVGHGGALRRRRVRGRVRGHRRRGARRGGRRAPRARVRGPVHRRRRGALRLGQRRRRRHRPGRSAQRRGAAVRRRRRDVPRQGARPRALRGVRRRSARPHHRPAAGRERPAPRARGRGSPVGRLPAVLPAAQPPASRASRRSCAGSTRSAATSRRRTSSRWPRRAAS